MLSSAFSLCCVISGTNVKEKRTSGVEREKDFLSLYTQHLTFFSLRRYMKKQKHKMTEDIGVFFIRGLVRPAYSPLMRTMKLPVHLFHTSLHTYCNCARGNWTQLWRTDDGEDVVQVGSFSVHMVKCFSASHDAPSCIQKDQIQKGPSEVVKKRSFQFTLSL